jgi:hypothetical protein
MNDYRDLLRRAELWATGATIHNVKQLSGSIEMAVMALSDEKRARKDMKGAKGKWCEMWLARLARTLEDWMGHGDYRRAQRDNPETAEEKRLHDEAFPENRRCSTGSTGSSGGSGWTRSTRAWRSTSRRGRSAGTW